MPYDSVIIVLVLPIVLDATRHFQFTSNAPFARVSLFVSRRRWVQVRGRSGKLSSTPRSLLILCCSLSTAFSLPLQLHTTRSPSNSVDHAVSSHCTVGGAVSMIWQLVIGLSRRVSLAAGRYDVSARRFVHDSENLCLYTFYYYKSQPRPTWHGICIS